MTKIALLGASALVLALGVASAAIQPVTRQGLTAGPLDAAASSDFIQERRLPSAGAVEFSQGPGVHLAAALRSASAGLYQAQGLGSDTWNAPSSI